MTYQEEGRDLSVHHGGDVDLPRVRVDGEHPVRRPVDAHPRDAVRDLLAHFAVRADLWGSGGTQGGL